MIIPKIKYVFDRRKKASSAVKGSVELRITVGHKQKFMSMRISLYPKEWDLKTESVKARFDAPELNVMLQDTKKNVLRMIMGMKDDIDIDFIFNNLKKCELIDLTFIEYLDSRIEDKQIREGTKRHYITLSKFLRGWNKIVTFSDITESNIRNMDEYLKKSGKMQSTVSKYHSLLKAIINDAVVDGYLDYNPYVSKRIRIDRGEKEYVDSLDEEKVNQLEQLKLPTNSLSKVRDLFLFQCYTGLAYSDLMKFDINDYKKDSEGRIYNIGSRTKTDAAFTIVLIEPAKRILEKYNNVLPKISNCKYNMYLKILGSYISVEGLHSHMGRATFATTALNHGISIDVPQHMIGHHQRNQTARYARMRDDTIKKSFDKLNDEIK